MFEEGIKAVSDQAQKMGLPLSKPSGSMIGLLNSLKVATLKVKDPAARKLYQKTLASGVKVIKAFVDEPSEKNKNNVIDFMKKVIEFSEATMEQKFDEFDKKFKLSEHKEGLEKITTIRGSFMSGCRDLMVNSLTFINKILIVASMAVFILIIEPYLASVLYVTIYFVLTVFATMILSFLLLPLCGIALISIYMVSTGKFKELYSVFLNVFKELTNKDWAFAQTLHLFKFLIAISGVLLVLTNLPTIAGFTGLGEYSMVLSGIMGTIESIILPIPLIISGLYCFYRFYKDVVKKLGYNFWLAPAQASSQLMFELIYELRKLFGMLGSYESSQAALARFKAKFSEKIPDHDLQNKINELTVEKLSTIKAHIDIETGNVSRELSF